MNQIKNNEKLGLWMSTSLVIGNMIGAGVFLMPAALAAYGGIRIVGWLLRPKMLDELGLLETIHWEADQFEEKTGIYCRVQFSPEEFEVEHERSSTTIHRVNVKNAT